MTIDNKYYIPTQGLERSRKICCLKIDTVNKCLTDNCRDCTGSYRNNLLGHRIICHCECHNKELRALESVEGPEVNALNVERSSQEET